MRCCWLLLAVALCADRRADTVQLAKHLEPFRRDQVDGLQREQYRSIQREYLAWVDARVKAGVSAERMNAELKAANLLSDGPQDFDRTYAGFLGKVSVLGIPGNDGLEAFKLGIYTGRFCNVDETVVIYNRQPMKRMVQLNAESTYSHGYYLRAFSTGKSALDGVIVASEWVASSCAGNWNRNVLRIESVRGEIATGLLTRELRVFGGGDFNLKIDNDVVEFDDSSGFKDLDEIVRQGIVRYRVWDGRAIRIAPIAKSYGGFIDEWLDMDDAEAARWGTPQASAQHHALRTIVQKLSWTEAADCPGSPSTRAISTEPAKSSKPIVYFISGKSPESMRMHLILNDIPASCRPIDLRRDRSSILVEPGAANR
jgi:hypothetical protein